jgi:addiction module HigA family antidote
MTLKSSITTTGGKVPLVRPQQGWDYQRVTTSPGEMLVEEFLKPLALSQNQLAQRTSLPASRIHAIIHGRTITAETALRLASFFNNSPEFWMNLQTMHDLSKAKLRLAGTLAKEVRPYTPDKHSALLREPALSSERVRPRQRRRRA